MRSTTHAFHVALLSQIKMAARSLAALCAYELVRGSLWSSTHEYNIRKYQCHSVSLLHGYGWRYADIHPGKIRFVARSSDIRTMEDHLKDVLDQLESKDHLLFPVTFIDYQWSTLNGHHPYTSRCKQPTRVMWAYLSDRILLEDGRKGVLYVMSFLNSSVMQDNIQTPMNSSALATLSLSSHSWESYLGGKRSDVPHPAINVTQSRSRKPLLQRGRGPWSCCSPGLDVDVTDRISR